MARIGKRARIVGAVAVSNIAVLTITLAVLALAQESPAVALAAVAFAGLAILTGPAALSAWRPILARRLKRFRIRELVLVTGGLFVVAAFLAGAALIDLRAGVVGVAVLVTWNLAVGAAWVLRGRLVRLPGVGPVIQRAFAVRKRRPRTPAAPVAPVAPVAPPTYGPGSYAMAPRSDARRRFAPVSPLGATRVQDLEHAAKRGYVSAALDALLRYAQAPGWNSQKRAQARFTRAYILDRVGRQAEGDLEAQLGVIADPASLVDDRAAARWVGSRARAGAVHESLSFIGQRAADKGFDPNVFVELLGADREALPDEMRLEVLSRLYQHGGFVGVERRDLDRPLALDNVRGLVEPRHIVADGPRVSILIPAYNCEDTLGFALDSILDQTYRNIEVIVADDASTDATALVVRDRMAADPRVRYIALATNSGAYVARNVALQQATGDLITVHDADDWAHPQQLAAQVARHVAEGSTVATVVERLRVDHGMRLHSGFARSSPTVMVDRAVMLELEGWQELRMNADTEFTDRFGRVYGRDAIKTIAPRVPFTLARMASRNLTADGPRGLQYITHVAGVRAHYQEAFRAWHDGERFDHRAPTVEHGPERPFVLPRLIDARLQGSATTDHVDVVLMSDFILPGGTTSANIREIRAWREAGKTVGLINHPRFPERVRGDINPKYWDVIDGDAVRLLTFGESVSTDLLVFIHPPMAVHLADELPDVRAERAVLVVNQAPRRLYDGSKEDIHYYDIDTVAEGLRTRFGVDVLVAPLSPSIREVLHTKHAREVAKVTLSDEDWLVCLDALDWERAAPRERDGRIVIGRHSRDGVEKWPLTKEDILGAYPESEPFSVRILGGARVPSKRIGYRPTNWRVHEFDSVSPRDFLAGLDVYVYFTHPTMVEAFGLAPLEALAVGVPLITSHDFEPIFGEAALYCEPREVAEVAATLVADPERYQRQVRLGRELVLGAYSFAGHVARVARLTGAFASTPADDSIGV